MKNNAKQQTEKKNTEILQQRRLKKYWRGLKKNESLLKRCRRERNVKQPKYLVFDESSWIRLTATEGILFDRLSD